MQTESIGNPIATLIQPEIDLNRILLLMPCPVFNSV